MSQSLKLTANLRGNITRLFITTTKSYKITSQDTLARCTKTMLQSAGIDMNIFTPHSIRSPSSRAATRIPIDAVWKTGGGGAWEHLQETIITIKILLLKKTLQIVFWTRFISTGRATTRIPIGIVLKTGGWRNMRTFAWEHHYNKDIFLKKTLQLFSCQTKICCHWLNLFCRLILLLINFLFHSCAHCLWTSQPISQNLVARWNLRINWDLLVRWRLIWIPLVTRDKRK